MTKRKTPEEHIVVDFETRSFADLPKVGSYRYAADESTEVVLCAWQSPQMKASRLWNVLDREPIPTRLARAANNPRCTFWCWNIDFDPIVWHTQHAKMGLPDVPDERWADIAARARAHGLPGSLDACCRSLGLSGKSGEGKEAMLRVAIGDREKGFPQVSPEEWEEYLKYGRRDAWLETSLLLYLGFPSEMERRHEQAVQAMNARGLCFDLELVEAAERLVETAVPRMNTRLAELTDGLVTALTQAARLKEWLAGRGLDLPNMQRETLEAAVLEDEADAEMVEAMQIRLLGAKSSVAKLRRIQTMADEDGVCRGLFVYYGAGPGRLSGRAVQPQNFVRDTLPAERAVPALLSGNERLVRATCGDPVTAVSKALRLMIVARPGHVLVGGDFSQIQAREVSWLAGEDEMTAAWASPDRDPYSETGDGCGTDRQGGKVAVLSLGFGGGWRALSKMGRKYGVSFDENEGERIKKAWRWANPRVVESWKICEATAVTAMRGGEPMRRTGPVHATLPSGITLAFERDRDWLTIELPSGRKLRYLDPRLEYDQETGHWLLTAMTTKGQTTYRRSLYGGLIFQNIVQGLEADIVLECQVALEKTGLTVVGSVHDEVICEVDARNEPEALEPTLRRVVMDTVANLGWTAGLPVDFKTWSGVRYGK